MKGAKQSCLYIIAFWLIASVTWSRAYAHGASPSTRPVVELPVGRVEADQEEWDKFLSENLAPDIKPWLVRSPLRTQDILDTYEKLLKEWYIPAVLQIVLVWKNRLIWPMRKDIHGTDAPEPASFFKRWFSRHVGGALASGRLQLPNCIFIYNTDDNAMRMNAPHRNQSVPIISVIKRLGSPDGDDMDILVPQMYVVPETMYYVPWEEKKDLAYFRGIPFCSWAWASRYGGRFDVCPRTYLAQLTERDKEAGNGTVLDVGMVEQYKVHRTADGSLVPNQVMTRDPTVVPRAPMSHHAHYRWLLHLEGITASSRLALLMLINSVVLYQRQPFIEHYYRSLREDEHYIAFWNSSDPSLGMDDIYTVIRDARERAAKDPEWPGRMVATASAFAKKFTTMWPRLRYYRDALEAYKKLFPDMDSFLEGYVAQLRAKGFNITE